MLLFVPSEKLAKVSSTKQPTVGSGVVVPVLVAVGVGVLVGVRVGVNVKVGVFDGV